MTSKPCALVTGGTRGIGFAIAKRLLVDGVQVVVTGTSANADFPKGGEYRQVNFLDDESMNNFISFIQDRKFDIVVNNAGINKIGPFADIKINDFDDILKVNLRSAFLICQAAIPSMQVKEWGRIINITSIFGNVTKEFRAPYSASKFGLDGMTAALAAELSEYNILANSIGPGFIDTELTRNVLGIENMEKIKNKIPIKRLGKVDEIAEFVSWLVSKKNTYITGQNIMIDGGFSRV